MTLSELAFRHRPLVAFVLLALMAFGVRSYFSLPAREDPAITIRDAVITTEYPGMSPERVERLITRPIEEAVRRLPEVEEIRSVSMPGRSIIHAEIYPNIFALDQLWDELRDRVAEAATVLPPGTLASKVNTDFGDVAVATVALLSGDHTWQDRIDIADFVSDQLYAVEGTRRVEVLGLQPEQIFIEARNSRLTELGMTPTELAALLKEQNTFQPGGIVDVGDRAFLVEPTGSFPDEQAVRDALVTLPGGRGVAALGDLAIITRGPADPPQRPAYYNGEPAIVFAVSMHPELSVLDYGQLIAAELRALETTLPAGFSLEFITLQSEQVAQAIYGVSANVLQTLVIVLVVVIFFLGLRTGLIVGSIVPCAMLITLSLLGPADVSLQRMSLATLVIALGLLVDNGIVVAEDFRRRMQEGASRDQALGACGRELAVPLLMATLTTILMFLPLMLAQHTAGEYTRSISIVILLSLLVSWLLAMTVTPSLCHRFVQVTADDDSLPIARPRLPERTFRRLTDSYVRLLRCLLRHRAKLLLLMLLLMVLALVGMSQVPKQFFPNSNRAQLLVYIDAPAGVTARTMDQSMQRVLRALEGPGAIPHVESHIAYIGNGGPRFVLSLTPIDPAPNKAFMLVNVSRLNRVGEVRSELQALFREVAPELSARVTRMFLGPSDSTKIEVQLKGPDKATLFAFGKRIKGAFNSIPGAIDVYSDWENRVPMVVVDVDQQRARRAGVSSLAVSRALARAFDGETLSVLREGDDQVPIVLRNQSDERRSLTAILATAVAHSAETDPVPVSQVANTRLVNAYGRIARENLLPTLTVEARNDFMTAEDMVPLLLPSLAKMVEALPPGHTIEFDGVVVDSAEAQRALTAYLPLCLLAMVALLVGQFNSYRRPALVFATIPLLLIGASAGLHLASAKFGFMVILGLYALAGIIVNNAIVLIDRIDTERANGLAVPDAIVAAAARRLRPIIMTTVTTILGLAPLILTKDPLFYGMASAIAGGLLVGTILTLGVVPVLYSLLCAQLAPPRPA
ncbi:MAG: efflux RND transporter permease subunit [Pseudohaliea sp.]